MLALVRGVLPAEDPAPRYCFMPAANPAHSFHSRFFFPSSASHFATSEQMEIDTFGWLSVYKEAVRSNQWVEARCWAAAIMEVLKTLAR